MSPGVAVCLVAASILALVAMITVAISAGLGKKAVFGCIGLGLVLIAIALSGCAACPPRPRAAPTCVVTEPPPDIQEQDDVEPLIAWAHATWNACASLRAEDYPPGPLEIEADDGEDD